MHTHMEETHRHTYGEMHKYTQKHTETHTETHVHSVQADRTRNAPVNEIRFLGGFAVGAGLQSTAAWGRGRRG